MNWWCFVWRATATMWVEFYSVYELCDLHVVRRAFVLWNLVAIIIIINALALIASASIDIFLCLLVKQLQLTIFVHTRFKHALLARSEQDVDFVRRMISLNQMKMHRSSYINAVLIQSREQVALMTCTQCTWLNDLRSFLKCRFISEHFERICINCKWWNHVTWCNLLETEDDESKNEWNENHHSRSFKREDDCTKQRRLRKLKLRKWRLLRVRDVFNFIVLN